MLVRRYTGGSGNCKGRIGSVGEVNQDYLNRKTLLSPSAPRTKMNRAATIAQSDPNVPTDRKSPSNNELIASVSTNRPIEKNSKGIVANPIRWIQVIFSPCFNQRRLNLSTSG